MSRWPTWCQTGCCLCDGAPHPEQRALVRKARAEARRMTLREAVRESLLFEGEQELGWTLRWATVGTLDAGGAPSGAEYECRLRSFWRIRMASQRARRRMARRLGLRPVMWVGDGGTERARTATRWTTQASCGLAFDAGASVAVRP